MLADALLQHDQGYTEQSLCQGRNGLYSSRPHCLGDLVSLCLLPAILGLLEDRQHRHQHPMRQLLLRIHHPDGVQRILGLPHAPHTIAAHHQCEGTSVEAMLTDRHLQPRPLRHPSRYPEQVL